MAADCHYYRSDQLNRSHRSFRVSATDQLTAASLILVSGGTQAAATVLRWKLRRIRSPIRAAMVLSSLTGVRVAGAGALADAMVRTGKGDRRAFAEVYTLTSNKLFGICFRISRDCPAAEDILHDVYLTIWRRAGSWDAGRGAAITWLAAIARNRSIDWQRLQRSRPQRVILEDWSSLVDPAVDIETSIMSAETARQLRLGLELLEPRTREAIRDAFFEGLTYEELARRHGIPLGTMKSCIRRGLAKLKAHLDLTQSR